MRVYHHKCPECGSRDGQYRSRTNDCRCCKCNAVYPVTIPTDYTEYDTLRAVRPRDPIKDEEIVQALTETPMRITQACRHFHKGRYVMSDRMNSLAKRGLLMVKADNVDMRAKLYGVW